MPGTGGEDGIGGAEASAHQFLLWLIVALAMLAASPASADAQLISVWPAVGSKLETAPSEVVLTFSEAFKPDRLEVRVLNSPGKVVRKGKPAIAGPAVSQALHIGGRHHRRDRHFRCSVGCPGSEPWGHRGPASQLRVGISRAGSSGANVFPRAPLAQLAEQLTLNQRVRGSSP